MIVLSYPERRVVLSPPRVTFLAPAIAFVPESTKRPVAVERLTFSLAAATWDRDTVIRFATDSSLLIVLDDLDFVGLGLLGLSVLG